MEKAIKVIVADTNWWISLAIKRFNNKFAAVLLSPALQFVSSTELTDEIKATFSKERLQKYLDEDIITLFWKQFEALVTNITVSSVITDCRDPKDNFLLALAKDSGADYLITGDKDLLDMKLFEKTIICTLTEFTEKYL